MRKYTRRVFASSLEKYTSKRTRNKTEDTRLGEKCILCVIFLVCVIYYENALCKFSRKAVTQHCARIGCYQPLRICCKYERFRKIEAIFVNKKNSSQIGISLKSHIFTSPCSSIETRSESWVRRSRQCWIFPESVSDSFLCLQKKSNYLLKRIKLSWGRLQILKRFFLWVVISLDLPCLDVLTCFGAKIFITREK